MVKSKGFINGKEVDGYDFVWNNISLFAYKPNDNSCSIYYKDQLIVTGIGTRDEIIERIPKELVDIVKSL